MGEGDRRGEVPGVRAASLQAQAAQRDAGATRAELIPHGHRGSLQERLTNPSGFVDNRTDYFTLEALATVAMGHERAPRRGARSARPPTPPPCAPTSSGPTRRTPS